MREKMLKLLKDTGAIKNMHQVLDQMLISIPWSNTKKSDFKDAFFRFENKMLDEMADVYGACITEDEADQLIQFYATPIGQKTISVLPIVTAKCSAIGAKYGELAEQTANSIEYTFKAAVNGNMLFH